MSIPNRALKAKAKIAADRIAQDIINTQLIRDGKIEGNSIRHIAESEGLKAATLPKGAVSVPLSLWLEEKEALKELGISAVQIASDESCEALINDLNEIELIVLPFVNVVDGRGYSNASKLRNRFSFKGEIRAVGDVHLDQLFFLARSGCNAFELAAGDDYQIALQALTEFSDVYQPATDGKPLVFARRRTTH